MYQIKVNTSPTERKMSVNSGEIIKNKRKMNVTSGEIIKNED